MLYAITDRRLYAENENDAQMRLVELASVWAANGVAFIQIREKDMPGRELVDLTRAVIQTTRRASDAMGTPRILVNGRADVALAAGADGVHLPAGPEALTPQEVRRIFAAAGHSRPAMISVSCHTLEEVKAERLQSADCILFAPVFEKVLRKMEGASDAEKNRDGPMLLSGTGLILLEQACQAAAPVPVLALGGVTAENAAACMHAGAAGIAAIRLLQEPSSVWKDLA